MYPVMVDSVLGAHRPQSLLGVSVCMNEFMRWVLKVSILMGYSQEAAPILQVNNAPSGHHGEPL